MIIKNENVQLEVFSGTDVYFESDLLGQIFKKWDDLDDNEKLILEILQKRIERLLLEFKEILLANELSEQIGDIK